MKIVKSTSEHKKNAAWNKTVNLEVKFWYMISKWRNVQLQFRAKKWLSQVSLEKGLVFS